MVYFMWLQAVVCTCVTAQQRLVSEVIDEVLKGRKLVETKHIDAVSACHMKMLHRVLRPVCQMTRNTHINAPFSLIHQQKHRKLSSCLDKK